MKTLTPDELRDIIEKHSKWLKSKDGGERANLRSANLRSANLSSANLSSANLSYADLRYADLSSANLSYANLSYADLRSADLSDADLLYADLRCANLRYADLSDADLSDADLRYADLRYADLRYANLSYADLRSAKNSEFAIAVTRIIPESGSFEGWKSCRNGMLVRVLIPADAKRSHAFGRKCRAEFVEVLEIVGGDVAVSKHDESVTYTVGQRVTCHEWCDDFTQESAGGIHFFITRLEAEKYE